MISGFPRESINIGQIVTNQETMIHFNVILDCKAKCTARIKRSELFCNANFDILSSCKLNGWSFHFSKMELGFFLLCIKEYYTAFYLLLLVKVIMTDA